MSSAEPITFVIPVNNREILDNNFLASPCLRELVSSQFIFQNKFLSAARAYNEAIERSTNDLMVFLHQDVFLPKTWISHLRTSLSAVETFDPDWGVLGCWGATEQGQCVGHIYSSGLGVLGAGFEKPQPVQTLDEVVLILRKSSGLRFTDSLPGFHFYGADVCMRALERGRKCYAISAFCIHNTRQLLILPEEFYTCYRKFRRVWRGYLPIYTTCTKVSRMGLEFYIRRLQELRLRLVIRKKSPALRLGRPEEILAMFDM
jgi:hypothetical protein